uniref:Uncharacterized protein n=1 Tax=Candidatus Kentrum sp. UNK TaxID=2126344 RepID=A0A451ASJ5_9GAMM|nr:MAG: hypothetical protein BECKUNK1418G_GA0071005_12941 [Candidatus Kentron sp. UNK]
MRQVILTLLHEPCHPRRVASVCKLLGLCVSQPDHTGMRAGQLLGGAGEDLGHIVEIPGFDKLSGNIGKVKDAAGGFRLSGNHIGYLSESLSIQSRQSIRYFSEESDNANRLLSPRENREGQHGGSIGESGNINSAKQQSLANIRRYVFRAISHDLTDDTRSILIGSCVDPKRTVIETCPTTYAHHPGLEILDPNDNRPAGYPGQPNETIFSLTERRTEVFGSKIKLVSVEIAWSSLSMRRKSGPKLAFVPFGRAIFLA